MRYSRYILSATLALACTPAVAADTPLDFEDIREQQVEIREQVVANQSPYDDMPERDRKRLVQRQDRLLAMIEGKDDALDLDERDRTEAINTLEWIRAAIHDAEEDRMVCRREKRVGTNMVTRVCKTVAEMRKDREEAQRAMSKGSVCADGRGCTGPGG